MAYVANVIADSVSEAGIRLTTMEVSFPRMVLAEFNTHRVFSRNSASSRAIPVSKQLERIKSDPFIPIYWGANQPGMQADGELSQKDQKTASEEWLAARDSAIEHVERLLEIGLHKQITNRILEPFMWHTVIVTATEWRNFFALRANPNAQPEIRHAAEMMQAAMNASTPNLVLEKGVHLPFIQPDEIEWASSNIETAVKVSVGRCARVSYLTHDGKRDHDKDVELYERLVGSGHMSPLEHVATPNYFREENGSTWWNGETPWSGNFFGWKQFRKGLPNESDFSKVEVAG